MSNDQKGLRRMVIRCKNQPAATQKERGRKMFIGIRCVHASSARYALSKMGAAQ
jgi:hypothetical protein